MLYLIYNKDMNILLVHKKGGKSMEKSILNAVKNAKQINGIPSYNELNHEILVK